MDVLGYMRQMRDILGYTRQQKELQGYTRQHKDIQRHTGQQKGRHWFSRDRRIYKCIRGNIMIVEGIGGNIWIC